MASCSKVESLETSAAGQIAFGDSFVEIKTREAVDPSTTTASINAFDVWAFMNEPSGTVFAGERVTKSESGEWTYNALQYWVPSKSYYFYAVSPVGDANISVDVAEINKIGIGEIAFTNENGTCDLIYAAKNVNTDAVIADNPDKVHLQFAHLLSKLKFTFTNLFTNLFTLGSKYKRKRSQNNYQRKEKTKKSFLSFVYIHFNHLFYFNIISYEFQVEMQFKLWYIKLK